MSCIKYTYRFVFIKFSNGGRTSFLQSKVFTTVMVAISLGLLAVCISLAIALAVKINSTGSSTGMYQPIFIFLPFVYPSRVSLQKAYHIDILFIQNRINNWYNTGQYNTDQYNTNLKWNK